MSHTCFEALSFPANHQDRHSCPPGPGRPSVSPSWSRASQKVSQSYLCTPGSAPQSSDAARISWQPHSFPAKPKAIFSGKFSKVNLNLNHSGHRQSWKRERERYRENEKKRVWNGNKSLPPPVSTTALCNQ